MTAPKTNPVLMVDRELASAIIHFEFDKNFQVFFKFLEQRRDDLALGASMPQDHDRRAEMCGRVQELVAIIEAIRGARKMVFPGVAPPAGRLAAGFGG